RLIPAHRRRRREQRPRDPPRARGARPPRVRVRPRGSQQRGPRGAGHDLPEGEGVPAVPRVPPRDLPGPRDRGPERPRCGPHPQPRDRVHGDQGALVLLGLPDPDRPDVPHTRPGGYSVLLPPRPEPPPPGEGPAALPPRVPEPLRGRRRADTLDPRGGPDPRAPRPDPGRDPDGDRPAEATRPPARGP